MASLDEATPAYCAVSPEATIGTHPGAAARSAALRSLATIDTGRTLRGRSAPERKGPANVRAGCGSMAVASAGNRKNVASQTKNAATWRAQCLRAHRPGPS